MKFLLLVIVLVAIFYNHGTDARIFNSCSLARELARLGVPRNQIATFVCIAQRESNFNTHAVNRSGAGVTDFGLFQINDQLWCNSGRRVSNNICNIHCNRFLNDDITATIRCARTIQRQQGFTAWDSYTNFCSRGAAGAIANCGI